MPNDTSKGMEDVPLNKIQLKEIKQDIVTVRIYEVYDKKHIILEFNGSYFLQSNAGNIQTCIEKELNQ